MTLTSARASVGHAGGRVGSWGGAPTTGRWLMITLGGALALFSLLRWVAPVRAGQFGPDEARLAVWAQQIVREAAPLPLVGLAGTRGVFYGPYPIYLYSALYAIANFDLGRVLAVTSLLALASAFLLAAAVGRRGPWVWTLILALTSPVAVYSSIAGLWDTPLLIPLAAATIATARLPTRRVVLRELGVGLALGLCLGSHLMAIPFVLGTLAWRYIVLRRPAPMASLLAGLGATVAPYAIGLWLDRATMALSLRTGGDEATVPDLFGLLASVFRFWGTDPHLRLVRPASELATVESDLARLTSLGVIVILVLGAACLGRQRRRPAAASLLTLTGLCTLAYLPFAYVTNASGRPDLQQAIWWIAPLVLPVCALGALGRRAGGVVLALLTGLNLLALGIQFGPRLLDGTSAETVSEPGQGPSWWMQLASVEAVCQRAAEADGAGAALPIIVETACKFCDSGVPALLPLQPSACQSQVRLVTASESPFRLRVQPSADGIHLEVVAIGQPAAAPSATTAAGSPAEPTSPPASGLVLWLAADGLEVPDGAPVARWPDTSGAGNDAAQSDPTRQPHLVRNALHGRAVVRFDGVQDVLLSPPAPLTQAHTVVVVGEARGAQDGTNDVFWSYAADAAAATLVESGVFHVRRDLRTFRVRYEGLDTFALSPSPALDGPVILAQRRDSAGHVQAFIDGARWLSSEEPTVDFSSPRSFRLGAHSNTGQYLDGDIAEVRVYDREVGDDELARITHELGASYAINTP